MKSGISGKSALLIMARLPRPGRVKTRLAKTLGSETATEFYKLCMERLFHEVDRLPLSVNCYLFYAGTGEVRTFLEGVSRPFLIEAQRGRNLGQRLAYAFQTAFAHGKQKAVVVGSDIPDLTAEIIINAFRLLDQYQLALGPDHNGGYYLLGMKKFYGELFEKKAWGTSRVREQTLMTSRALGLSVASLPILMDIDTEADLRLWFSSRDRRSSRLEKYVQAALSA